MLFLLIIDANPISFPYLRYEYLFPKTIGLDGSIKRRIRGKHEDPLLGGNFMTKVHRLAY